jgi:8-oxo-dGTP pyrophosphatase MutT (NUDIX family)
MIQQSGAVPFRFQNGEPLFLVINNRDRTRWLVPKGIVEKGQTAAEAAAKEAMEEAGVTGKILAQSLGVYSYRKWDDVCNVNLYVLFVTEIHEKWDEDYFRKRRWINWEEFFKIVDERIPRLLLDKIPEFLKFTNHLNKKEEKL